MYVCIYLSIYHYLSIYLSIYLIYLPSYLSICLSIYLSIYLHTSSNLKTYSADVSIIDLFLHLEYIWTLEYSKCK